MPATVQATSPPASNGHIKPGASHPKKIRIVRRRGRAKNELGSDDEIQREAATDSESDGDRSSPDSASDSDTQPASEDVIPNGNTRVLTPSISQSAEEASLLDNEVSAKVMNQISGGTGTSFFESTADWSEMVADETTNGPAALPVIDFNDFNGSLVARAPSRTRKVQKPARPPPPARTSASAPPESPSGVDLADSSDNSQLLAVQSVEPSNKRPAGKTARQAYQQRLENDPSYVPTVGEFWGHDDRLIDKELRSLSGWWRAAWQGRARGRGGFDRGFSIRGRGRGVRLGITTTTPTTNDSGPQFDDQGDASDLPPIEQTWGHDGFEEMARKEEHRRINQDQPRRGGFRGRGGFPSSRARGGFVGGSSLPLPTAHAIPLPPVSRPWFVMKPERVWTKQHEAFLHFDPALKPRPGQGPSLRVRLPGREAEIIRAPAGAFSVIRAAPIPKQQIAIFDGSEEGDKAFVVRIPKLSDDINNIVQKNSEAARSTEETITTVEEPPIEDVFTVRPELQTRTTIPPSQHSSADDASTSTAEPTTKQDSERPTSEPQIREANDQSWVQQKDAATHNPPADESQSPESSSVRARPTPAVLAPLQTIFSPVPQPSTSYSSPYTYVPSLPPGIAMGQNGVPYEMATGRAVYLQPPTMYNPRPIVHAPIPVSYTPGHVRHHSSVTPDFLAQPHVPPHTPPIGTFMDPSTGTAMFSLPRQSSRIEIRSPTDIDGKGESKTSNRRPSGLRSSTTLKIPNPDDGQAYFSPLVVDPGAVPPYASADAQNTIDSGHQSTHDPAAMGYPSYLQQYYYPETYGYGQYMDMSQVQAYDMYPSDSVNSQSANYY